MRHLAVVRAAVRLAAASSSRACCVAALSELSPPSMRRISATTPSPSRRSTRGRRPARRATSFSSRKWASAREATCGRWVMQMHLALAAQRPQPLADDPRRVAADAGVDLVEDHRPGARRLAEAAQRQHHPRELAARGGVAQRRRLDPGVGRDPQLDRLAAARRRSRRGAAPARPRARPRPSRAAPAPRRRAPRSGSAAASRPALSFSPELRAPRFGRGQRRLGLGAALLGALQPGDLLAAALGVGEHRLDAAAVLALEPVDRLQPLLDRLQRPGSASIPSA